MVHMKYVITASGGFVRFIKNYSEILLVLLSALEEIVEICMGAVSWRNIGSDFSVKKETTVK